MKDEKYETEIFFDEKNFNIEDFKSKYNISDNVVILKVLRLKMDMKIKRNNEMSYTELLSFLKRAMNCDDMQIWLLRKRLECVELTLDDMLKKFFELKTNDEILILYDMWQNCNQDNINNIRKKLTNK